MYRLRQTVSMLLVIALVSLGVTAQAQRRPYRVSDRQVEQIIRRIEVNSDRFRSSLDRALDSGRLDGTRQEDNINEFVRNFENATDELRSRFNDRRSVAADVENVLNSAAQINGFMQRNRFRGRVQTDWAAVRTDLNSLANIYNVGWSWNNRSYPSVGGQSPTRINDTQVERIIRQVEDRTDRFRSSVDAALDRSRLDGTRREDNINEFISEFEKATNQLRERFNNRSAVATDVEAVLNRAADIDGFMRRNRLTTRAENDWSLLKTDLNALAGAYNVAWNWNNRIGPTTGSNRDDRPFGDDALLTGTYRLDQSRSDNPRDVADRATSSLPAAERRRVYDIVLGRLESPEMLAIERRGRTITIASSRAAQTNFEVDGRERSEQLPNGRVARVSATFSGDQLVITSTGYRENDFNVVFDPVDNGRRLEVTRRIYSERLVQPVVVRNIYDRTSDIAQWNIYNDSRTGPIYNDTASGDFIIRNGETIVAVLNNDISTKRANEGDRFSMTVRSPNAYDGAVIEGTISNVNRSGQVSGRSGVTFNFDRIRMPNGQTSRFAGFVESVRTLSGETVRVDNEGSVEDKDSQTEKTIQRAAIGTAVGAIIGAIAGGGKGAAIGAVIGAGAGAGSVYVQGRDDLELMSGSEVTIRASAPNNR